MKKRKLPSGFIKRKVAASTLPEALIAIVIIAFSVSVLTLVLSNLPASLNAEDRVKAELVCDKALSQCLSERSFFSQNFTVDKFSVNKEVSAYSNSGDLVTIHIRVNVNNGKTLAEQLLIQHHVK